MHIDDDPKERFLVRNAILLTNTPFEFYEAADVKTAISFFQVQRRNKRRCRCPELVLLDYDLGDHTGIDFLYWLRLIRRTSSIPVVMFSGSVGKPHIAECYSTGANFFVRKPRSLSRLKIIVQALHENLVARQNPSPICALNSPICALYEYLPDPT